MSEYDFGAYCSMMADESRMKPHIEALRKAVKLGAVVLDLGSGTGIFSLLACQFGARKVYSIESSPLLELAKGIAYEHGYHDRIEFIQEVSKDVELPEKVDILICDLRGSTPFGWMSISSIIDARERFLKPDGIIIAQKDVMYYSLVNSEKAYDYNIGRFMKGFYGFDFVSARRLLTNRALFGDYKDLTAASEPKVFVEIDYRTIADATFQSTMEWEIDKSATIHGLQGWFDIDLGFGERITTSRENPDNVWGCQFLPFEQPIEAVPGERVRVNVGMMENKFAHIWSWQTEVFSPSDAGNPRLKFMQSTKAGEFTSPGLVLKQSEFFVPRLNENGEMNRLFLSSVDGEMMVGDIADLLLEKYPDKFKSFEEALASAANMSVHYSE